MGEEGILPPLKDIADASDQVAYVKTILSVVTTKVRDGTTIALTDSEIGLPLMVHIPLNL